MAYGEVLTRDEVAKRLRLGVKAIRRMEQRGVLRAIRFGGRAVRFLADDVDKLLGIQQERRKGLRQEGNAHE